MKLNQTDGVLYSWCMIKQLLKRIHKAWVDVSGKENSILQGLKEMKGWKSELGRWDREYEWMRLLEELKVF